MYLWKILYLIVALCLVNLSAISQRQLLLVSGNKIIHRLKEGDAFRYKLLNNNEEQAKSILSITEFDIVASLDTIPISRIKKVVVKGQPLIRRIGINLIKVGAVYFLADQFNSAVIQQNPSIDDSVWKISTVLVGTGLPMIFFRKNWKRLGRDYKLKSVGPDSDLYVPD
jgi:hypothetical protein